MEQLDKLLSTLNLNSNDFVLDLGCGLGKVAEYIQMKTGAKITGIDFAEQLIQWANDNKEVNNDRLVFQVDNINDLSFSPSTFSVIYAIDTLYPTNIHNLNATIGKLKSLLKPKGQLGIFFAQLIETTEQQEFLAPNHTKMAQALQQNGFSFTVIDFTKNSRDIWVKELSIGKEMYDIFEIEGNRDLVDDRIADSKECLHRIDNQLQKRYFYHASLK